MTFHQQLTTTMWTFYVFLQTSDQTDWAQPLLTVSTALQQTDLWAAAVACRCVEALCQELASALLQFLGVLIVTCHVLCATVWRLPHVCCHTNMCLPGT